MTETARLQQVVSAIINQDVDQAKTHLHDIMVDKMRNQMTTLIPTPPTKED